MLTTNSSVLRSSTFLFVFALVFGGFASSAAAQPADGPILVQGPAGIAEVRAGASSIGDINNDDTLDVLVTGDVTGGDDETPGTTLYLGNGDGTFSPAGASLTDVRLSASAMADVNDDGNQDLVITGREEGEFSSSPTATLYLGNGDGTFSQPGDSFTGVEEGSVSIADVDGSNGPDVLITGQRSDGTTAAMLYLQQGDGSFSEAGANLTGVMNSSTAIADVNDDGQIDILLTGGQESGSPANPISTLYLGNGDGSFSTADAGLTDVARSSASIDDVDGDGNEDLLVVGAEPQFLNTFAILYYGNEDGTFTEVTTSTSGLTAMQSGDAAIADFDDDGTQDILLSGEPESGESVTTTLFLGNGDRTFSPANTGLVDVGFSAISVADFYDDGDPDVMLTGDAVPGLADDLKGRFYVNNTNQTPPNRAPIFVQPPNADTLAAGRTLTDTVEAHDPDGDRLASLQTSDGGPDVSVTLIDTGTVEVNFTPSRVKAGRTPNLGFRAEDVKGTSSTVTAPIRVPPFFGIQSNTGLGSAAAGATATADVDGNGTTDLFVANTGTLYLGRENGTFDVANADFGTIGSFGAATFGDVNDDGNPDLVFSRDTNPDSDFFSAPKTTLHLGNGDGTFDQADNANLTDVYGGHISIGDVNNDQNQDLLITGGTDSGDSTVLYLGNGDGTFSTANANLTALSSGATAIGDVNGDDDADLLLTGLDDSTPTTELYLGNGDGTFQEDTPFSIPNVSANFAGFADVSGDDTLDLVLIGNGSGFRTPTATVLLGNGDGTFNAANANLTGITGGSAALTDVNSDGNTDLFVAGDTNDGGSVVPSSTLYLGDGSGNFSVAGAGIEAVARPPTAVADIDGDGDNDLALLGPSALYQNLSQERTPAVTASNTVDSDGTVDFGNTGTDINFSDVSGSGQVTVERFDSVPLTPNGIDESNVSEYRLTIEGASGLSFNSAEVQLAVDAFSGIDDPTNVTMYKRPTDGTSAFTELTTTVGDNGTAGDVSDDTLYASVSSFSEFVLASNSEPLPVELVDFTAQVDDNQVHLSWQTASETRNAGFRVQRRTSGAHADKKRGEASSLWTTVGRVDGSGTTTEAQSYQFTDGDLPYEANRLSYRLKQLDTDGTESYSTTVSVKRGVTEVQLLGTYPNPTRQQTTVRYAVPEKQETTIRLYDALGRQVRTVVGNQKNGRHAQPLDVSGLSSGVYFLRLRSRGIVKTRKLTIVR